MAWSLLLNDIINCYNSRLLLAEPLICLKTICWHIVPEKFATPNPQAQVYRGNTTLTHMWSVCDTPYLPLDPVCTGGCSAAVQQDKSSAGASVCSLSGALNRSTLMQRLFSECLYDFISWTSHRTCMNTIYSIFCWLIYILSFSAIIGHKNGQLP